jgi:hypothetical protein
MRYVTLLLPRWSLHNSHWFAHPSQSQQLCWLTAVNTTSPVLLEKCPPGVKIWMLNDIPKTGNVGNTDYTVLPHSFHTREFGTSPPTVIFCCFAHTFCAHLLFAWCSQYQVNMYINLSLWTVTSRPHVSHVNIHNCVDNAGPCSPFLAATPGKSYSQPPAAFVLNVPQSLSHNLFFAQQKASSQARRR